MLPLRSLSLLLAALFFAVIPLRAQTSTTITSSNDSGTIEVEFLGVTDNGDGTYTWSYRVTEISGKDMSHWVLGLCMDLARVVDFTPEDDDDGIEEVELGTDSGGTSITGIKWDVEDDFDDDGDDDQDTLVFSFTLNMEFETGAVPVGFKTGGPGSPENKSGTGSIDGPVCTPGDKCDAIDTDDLPSWDGVITNNEDGTGSTVLSAPLGLKRIELFDEVNLVLDDVQDGGGTSLVGTDQFECTVSNSDGCLKYVWTGDEDDAPTEATLILRAPNVAGSFFFVHFTDCCDHTIRVDPQFTLHEPSESRDRPETFALNQNYPNPFNPSTTIRFELPEAASVRLVVYDLLGREVATLLTGNYPAGAFSAVWDGRDHAGAPMPSGVYLLRLEAGAFVQTRRMTLLK